jgi:hypothetical protein
MEFRSSILFVRCHLHCQKMSKILTNILHSNLELGHPGVLISFNFKIRNHSQTHRYICFLARYTIYLYTCALLVYVSAQPSHH